MPFKLQKYCPANFVKFWIQDSNSDENRKETHRCLLNWLMELSLRRRKSATDGEGFIC